MTHVFPTLDSLRPKTPKAIPPTEWVAGLGTVPPPTAKVTGWTPPILTADAPKVDETAELDALRKAALEAGFRAGYAEGKASGLAFGHAEGLRAGREEGRTEVHSAEKGRLEEFREALSATVAEVNPAVRSWQESVEARATEMAMDAVRALLAAELSIERPDAMGIVREALGHAEGALRATIRLAPFDRAALAERKEEILQTCASLRDVELVDDRSIVGGCIVETDGGVVDATLATRLSLLEAA